MTGRQLPLEPLSGDGGNITHREQATPHTEFGVQSFLQRSASTMLSCNTQTENCTNAECSTLRINRPARHSGS